MDNFTWSYSMLNSFWTCKTMWYLTYITRVTRGENFFSQFGTFCHKIIEMYNEGELELFELVDYYKNNYEISVNMVAPPNKYVSLDEKYYNAGLDYFLNFQGSDEKIISAEENFKFELDIDGVKRKFVGVVDEVSEDESGNVNITDHKSRRKFSNEKEKDFYLNQLYLYSIPVKEKYGKYPNKLIFNLFREGIVEKSDFSEDKLDKALEWAKDTINSVYKETEFEPTISDFFCKYICSCKSDCPYYGEQDLTDYN